MATNDKKPAPGDDDDAQRGLVSPVEHSDAYGPVIDRDLDRATGEGERPAEETPERERPGGLGERGIEQVADPLAGDARTDDADSSGSRR
jgi:hypothetical protein